MKISEILRFLDEEKIPYTFEGNEADEIEGYSSLKNYRSETFTWIKDRKNLTGNTGEIKLAFACEQIEGKASNLIRTDNLEHSKRAFFSCIERFYGNHDVKEGVGSNCYIGPDVRIGKNVRIGHNCVLDGKIVIGDNTRIWNHVTMINNITTGRFCEIRSGAVIGHDDSISYTEDENLKKIPVKHFGGVLLGDNVVIGENSTVCRGTIDNTVLEDNVWIDAQTMISHNCYLHKNATVVGASRLFGSVTLEENAYVTSAIIRNQLTIGRDALVGMGAVVTKDVASGITVVGNPAKEFSKGK